MRTSDPGYAQHIAKRQGYMAMIARRAGTSVTAVRAYFARETVSPAIVQRIAEATGRIDAARAQRCRPRDALRDP